MNVATKNCRNEALAEIDALPEEYLPFLLQSMRAFRESVTLKSASESFRQGWSEARSGMTSPVEDLWDGINSRISHPLRSGASSPSQKSPIHDS
ncbi:MAG: hypothetical protein ACP5SH_09580 [Syntrophobacteraceae bacterium]